MKRLLATGLVFALCTSVVHADLQYSTQVDVRQAAGSKHPPGTVAVLQALMPTGETRTFIRSDAMRVEQGAGATATVLLVRPDGQFILHPGSRTYARILLPAGGARALDTQAPVVHRTGEFATILGLRAERVLVTMTLALPIAPQAGFPSAMTVDAEIWLANAYSSEAVGLRKLKGPVDGIAGELEGMALRQLFKIPQLGYEVETRVTELVEGPIDARLFDIPADYHPVEQPLTPGRPGDGRR